MKFFFQALTETADSLQPAVKQLAELGWFPSGQMGISEIHAFSTMFEKNDLDGVNRTMIDWIQSELLNIQSRLCNRYPHREKIFSAAFAAHQSCQFELSTPIFLIQADGICHDTLNEKLFSTKNIKKTGEKLPTTRLKTDSIATFPLSATFLLPIREIHGLNATEKERDVYPESPNRHEILHGISTNYGTSVNSLKAISMLEYFCTFVAPRFDKDYPQLSAERLALLSLNKQNQSL
jgi:hypothetical protein